MQLNSSHASVYTVADTGAEEEVSIVTQDGKKIRATLHDGRLDLNTIKKELVNEGWGLCLLDGVIPSCYHNGLSCSKFKPGSVIQVVIEKKRGEANCVLQLCKMFSQHTLQRVCKNRPAAHFITMSSLACAMVLAP